MPNGGAPALANPPDIASTSKTMRLLALRVLRKAIVSSLRHADARETARRAPANTWEHHNMITHYRWATSVLSGRWCLSKEEALFDAFRAGQAIQASEQSDKIVLQPFARIDEQKIYRKDVASGTKILILRGGPN